MKKLITKYPVTCFYIATLLSVFLLALCNMLLFPTSSDYMLMFPQLSPALSALLIVYLINGKSGVFELVRRTAFVKKDFLWYFVALITPLIICGLSYIILSLNGYAGSVFSRSLDNYAICLLAVFLGSYGEELGWRGFMQVELQKKRSLFMSTFIVGVFWGLWHLNFDSGILVFLIYMFMTVEISFVISWLFKNTNNKILAPVILHSLFNFCTLIFFEKLIMSDGLKIEMMLFFYGIYSIILFIPCVWIVRNMKHKTN